MADSEPPLPPSSSNNRNRNRGGNNRNPPAEGESSNPPRNRQRRPNPNPRNKPPRKPDDQPQAQPPNARKAKFQSSLTNPSEVIATTSQPIHSNPRPIIPTLKDDLTSTLIRALRTHPYPDCPICFSAIHPAQPTWSCSPLTPLSEEGQCCWTTFHTKCIRSWAGKSVKELADAWRARGEDRKGEWRCPGCQAKREVVPNGYWCFCGSTPEPKPGRLATPHSCGNPCSRPRTCGHACPISCHPGPCPPCQITTHVPCYCGKETLAFKCGSLGKEGEAERLTCKKPCGKPLGCGNHKCQDGCHPGACAPCSITVQERCYCGKSSKDLGCGEGEAKESLSPSRAKWTGKFECELLCNLPFSCTTHKCLKKCHPPSSTPQPCPFSLAILTHCPCGKHPISPTASPFFPASAKASLNRQTCTDPISTCLSICDKPLGCGHGCGVKCHEGACPPCQRRLVRPCRCGATTRDIRCGSHDEGVEGMEILCDKPCTALRACGRHQCNRLCCPLSSFSSSGKGKGKRRAATANQVEMDEGGLHECDLVCGKVLGCGIHPCEERDHKGPCPPCLRSSFVEMICPCNRTILEPPIPCGTALNCNYPCALPPPVCGHPRTQHPCHQWRPSTDEAGVGCPPCVFLTRKVCACGKKEIGNVKCSQERISCGSVCGKLLGCGFHLCEKLCHGGDCGACSATCGKPRKLCLPGQHPCQLPCHAPSACSETQPCQSIISLTCPCYRLRQSVACGKSTTSPQGREGSSLLQLKCTTECAIAKRNARLADALGINPDEKKGDKSEGVNWAEEVVGFGRVNPKLVHLVEMTFSQFIVSDKKTQVLPHMPPERRKFVHDVASVYRMDTQMVDQEPHRSVQLFKRIDSRIPSPLLSKVMSSSVTPVPSLGKLADLRAPIARVPLQGSSSSSLGGGKRGWASVSVSVSTPPPPKATTPQGSSSAQRVVGRSTPPVGVAVVPHVEIGDVPDDWEDDV